MPDNLDTPGVVLIGDERNRITGGFCLAFCGRTFEAMRFWQPLWSIMHERGCELVEFPRRDLSDRLRGLRDDLFVLNQSTEQVARTSRTDALSFFGSDFFVDADGRSSAHVGADWFLFDEELKLCLSLNHDNEWLLISRRSVSGLDANA